MSARPLTAEALSNLEHLHRDHEGSIPGDTMRRIRAAEKKLKVALWNDRMALLGMARELLNLESQLAFIHGHKGHAGVDIMTPERIAAWATELGWKAP